ncbi:MAG: hypothetical protein JWQ01_2572 [Massilia sp.]|nr:hypothetical protein [Massilia sp.]
MEMGRSIDFSAFKDTNAIERKRISNLVGGHEVSDFLDQMRYAHSRSPAIVSSKATYRRVCAGPSLLSKCKANWRHVSE